MNTLHPIDRLLTVNDRQLHDLATSLQLLRPYPFTFRTLDLLEGFFRANPEPNEAERALLASVGHTQVGYIEHWCKRPGNSGRVVHR